jgi:hypothetical protein
MGQDGGPELRNEFMDELRVLHLGVPEKHGRRSALERLTKAYQAALAENVSGA